MARTFGGRGGWDVDALLAEMPEPVFQRWMTYYRIDPWGEERGDLRSGLVCSMLDACHRTKGQPKPPISFMPYVSGPKKAMGQDDMRSQWNNIARHWGKKEKR